MRKKSLVWLIASAALIVTGCSNDESIDSAVNEKAVMKFDVYASRPNQQVRGLAMDLNALKGTNNGTDAGFSVVGYSSANNTWTAGASSATEFMKADVKANSNTWEYSPLRYWNGDNISFFAYAPKANVSNWVRSTGEPSFDYTLASTTAAMEDVVTAVQVDQNQSPVAFTFKHIMSRVGFQLKTNITDANNKVVVTAASMTISDGSGLNSKATYTYAGESDGAGSWSYGTGTALTSSAYTLPGKLDKAATGLTGYDTQGVVLTSSAADFLVADGTNDPYLYLIPSNGNITGANIEFTFTYDIVYSSNGSTGWTAVSTDLTKTIDLSAKTISFAQGTAYNLIFTVGLDAISFDVTSVDTWGSPSDVDL